ncbi:MAG: YdaU family protein [Asticcacaulis sp.]|uniref:DUF1376 domain-containing protein n=1 Tax=Asticcacaulis sp. TaxID=1872648 RepID=UPI0039E5C552
MSDLKINSYPMHIGDWHSGTSRMSLAEAGAYIRLCNQYYLDQGDGWTVNECLRLCAAMSRDEQKAVKNVLASKFEAVDGGYRHDGMDKRIAEIQAASERNQERARRAANARHHGKQSSEDAASSAASNAPSTQQAVLEECDPKAKSQKPDNKIDDDGASASDWPDLDKVLSDLQASAGMTPAEWQAHTARVLISWRNSGFSYRLDVVPTVKAVSARMHHAPKSWAYFTDSVAQACADRTKIIPLPDAQPPPPRRGYGPAEGEIKAALRKALG